MGGIFSYNITNTNKIKKDIIINKPLEFIPLLNYNQLNINDDDIIIINIICNLILSLSQNRDEILVLSNYIHNLNNLKNNNDLNIILCIQIMEIRFKRYPSCVTEIRYYKILHNKLNNILKYKDIILFRQKIAVKKIQQWYKNIYYSINNIGYRLALNNYNQIKY
jgi:hypothetical protein